jgi:hypothetical protein
VCTHPLKFVPSSFFAFMSATPQTSSHSLPHLASVHVGSAGCQIGERHRRHTPSVPYFPAHSDGLAHHLPFLLCRSVGIPTVRGSSPGQSLHAPSTGAPPRRCRSTVEPLPSVSRATYLPPPPPNSWGRLSPRPHV